MAACFRCSRRQIQPNKYKPAAPPGTESSFPFGSGRNARSASLSLPNCIQATANRYRFDGQVSFCSNKYVCLNFP